MKITENPKELFSNNEKKISESGEVLSLNQMNELSAAILKAEIMGNKVFISAHSLSLNYQLNPTFDLQQPVNKYFFFSFFRPSQKN